MSLATSLTLWSALVLGQTGLPPVPLPQTEPATDPAIVLPSDATPQQLEHIEQAARQLREAGLSGLASQLESALKTARQTELRNALAEKQAQLQTLHREVAELQKQLQTSEPIIFRFTILKVDRDRLRQADPVLAQLLVNWRQAGGGTAVHAPPAPEFRRIAGQPDSPKPFPLPNPKPSLTVAELLKQLVAAKESGAVNILAEPTLLTHDGQEARLHTGGKFPIPVSQKAGEWIIENRDFGTTVTVRPRLVTPNTVHCIATYEQSDLNFDHAVIMAGGIKVPGITMCSIQERFTAKFGETVMLPSAEVEPAVTLVFVAVEAAGKSQAASSQPPSHVASDLMISGDEITGTGSNQSPLCLLPQMLPAQQSLVVWPHPKAPEAKQAQQQSLEQGIAAMQKDLEQPTQIGLRFTILQVDRDKLHAADAALAEQLTMRIAARGGAVPQPDPVTTPLDVAVLLKQLCQATETGAVKKLATPSVVVLDGKQATVSTGRQLPVIVGHAGAPLPRFLENSTTLTVRPRLVTPNVVHCFGVFEQADLNFDQSVVSAGGSKVPGLTKRQIAAQFTAKFGETVMFPSPEVETAVTLVFVAVDVAAKPQTVSSQPPLRAASDLMISGYEIIGTEPNLSSGGRLTLMPPTPHHGLVVLPRPQSPPRSISPISYLLQSLMGADSFFGPAANPEGGRVAIDFDFVVEDTPIPQSEPLPQP